MSELEVHYDNFVLDDTQYQTKISKRFQNRKPYQPKDLKKIHAFIPGSIVQIFLKVGQQVHRGDHLLVLEAMKMKNNLSCPLDGKIKSVNVSEGQTVIKNQLLIELE